MRLMPEITLRRSGVYFKKTRRVLWPLFSSTILKVEIYPSSLRMRAISLFKREAGTSTRWCLAAAALRMLVRKSAMGSVCIIFLWSPLPARFHDAGNLSPQRHAAEADAAHFKLADIRASAPTDAAAVAVPDLELRFLLVLYDLRGTCH